MLRRGSSAGAAIAGPHHRRIQASRDNAGHHVTHNVDERFLSNAFVAHFLHAI